MKTRILPVLGKLLLLCTIGFQPSIIFAQGTAFTYQGRLNSGTNAASGSYDLTFTLFNTNITGVASAGPVTSSAAGVSNGLFLVTLDFGSVFTGTNYWLEIGVRTNGGGAFTTLSPRQQLTPTPYAIFAEGASNVFGVVPSGGVERRVFGGGVDEQRGEQFQRQLHRQRRRLDERECGDAGWTGFVELLATGREQCC